jgi:hypothetical protein
LIRRLERDAMPCRRTQMRFDIETSQSKPRFAANVKYRPHKILTAKALWLKILAPYSRATCLFSRF